MSSVSNRKDFNGYLSKKFQVSLEKAEFYSSALLDKFLPIKRYLKDFDGKLCSPSPMLDQIWHELILNTRYYAKVCSNGEFIHHDAGAWFDGVEAKARRYQKTLETYDMLFGKESRLSHSFANDDENNKNNENDEKIIRLIRIMKRKIMN
jgi:hypothetical protein